MLRRFFQKRNANDTLIRTLYGQIVAQARQPIFYSQMAVPDTLDGRFNMIVVHCFLVFHRWKDADENARSITQDIFDTFRLDMDRSLRELGVGDTTVPKRLKKMMQVFYGRVEAYEAAFAADDAKAALADAVIRNILSYNDSLFSNEEDNSGSDLSQGRQEAGLLAQYMIEVREHLKILPDDALTSGSLSFPEPEA